MIVGIGYDSAMDTGIIVAKAEDGREVKLTYERTWVPGNSVLTNENQIPEPEERFTLKTLDGAFVSRTSKGRYWTAEHGILTSTDPNAL